MERAFFLCVPPPSPPAPHCSVQFYSTSWLNKIDKSATFVQQQGDHAERRKRSPAGAGDEQAPGQQAAGADATAWDKEVDVLVAGTGTAIHAAVACSEFGSGSILIVEKDPEYIFVLDRDAAIQTEGAQLAQEVMENDLVKGTQAYQNGNIVYLAHPAVWYTAEGGITALDLMLQDLESELLEE